MVDREKLLEISGSKHAREIYKHIKESKEMTHYRELCQKLEFPSVTINRYLKIMEEANIIKGEWHMKTVSEEYNKKDSKSKISRKRKVWVRAFNILQTDEAKTFDWLIYGN